MLQYFCADWISRLLSLWVHCFNHLFIDFPLWLIDVKATLVIQGSCFCFIRQQQFYFFPLRFCETFFFLGAHNFCVLTFSVWIRPWLNWNLLWNCHYKNVEKSLFTVFLSFLLMNHWEDFNGCKLWKVIRYGSFERCIRSLENLSRYCQLELKKFLLFLLLAWFEEWSCFKKKDFKNSWALILLA